MTLFKIETIDLVLPYSKAKVKLYKKFPYGEILKYREKKIDNEVDQKIELAITLIESWDFTDDKNNAIDINIVNFKKLENKDANYIIAEANKAITEKKTSK